MKLTRSACFTLLLSLVGLSAHATILTIDRDLPPAAGLIGTSFAADTANDRAWVVVDYIDHTADGDLVRGERVEVPGLTYDAATRTIRLQEGGRELTCAVGRKVLWVTSFRATADCPVGVREVQGTDDGDPAPAGKTHVVVDVRAAR
jgi:hypothetical protein